MKKAKKMPTANKILSDGFKKLSPQVADTDAENISKTTGLSATWVREYLKGKVADFNTGSIILTELKKIIKEREDFALELVA